MEQLKRNRSVLWNRNFIQCCISYFLMNLSFYMLLPTMPLYLTEGLGMSAAQAGLILSCYTVGVMCVRPFSGYLVDCFSRKTLYLLAFTLFAAMFAGYLVVSTALLIMLVRFLQGGFMGLTSVSGNTIAIDVIPSLRRGEGMGFYGLSINLAMSLAPLIAVAVYNRHGFIINVWIGLVIAFAGVGSVLLINYPKREGGARPRFSFDRFILVKALPTALAYTLSAVPYGMVISFVVLYGKETGIADPGYFFILMAIGVGMARLVSGRLVDSGKIHTVAICSLLLLICVFAVFALWHNTYVFFTCAWLIGTGFGINVPAFQCLFVNVATPEMRGTATSTYLTSFDLGMGLGMLTAGYITAHADISYIYLAGSIACLLSLFIYVYRVRPSYAKHNLLKQ
ncbi:MAG: MFS transporter [Tannerellaceae bacterium]|nr:MFS transporter [Tannerellaceae bacterium]